MSGAGELEIVGVLPVGSDCDGGLMGVSEKGEKGDPSINKGGNADSPNSRRSLRKKSLRSSAARGRHGKTNPRSPLVRMAEMRRGGLRGRDLRQVGLNAGLRPTKGTKDSGVRELGLLEAIPEIPEQRGTLLEAAEKEIVSWGRDDQNNGSVEVRDTQISQSSLPLGSDVEGTRLPFGDSSDRALDMIAAQPL